MRIVELRSKNVKRLSAVHVMADESVNVIGGKNGAGKSSVLDSIVYALSGAKSLPGKPVRNGEGRAEIEIKLDGQPNLIIRRKIDASSGKSVLEVEQVDGDGVRAKIASPQKLLDSLVGPIAFDPVAFVRLRPQEQVEMLRTAVGVTTDDLDASIDRLFDERTAVNRDVKALGSQLDAMPKHSDLDATDEISAADILREIEDARLHNEHGDELERELEKAVESIDRNQRLLEETDAELIEARRKVEQLEKAVVNFEGMVRDAKKEKANLQKKVDEYGRVDLAPLTAKLQSLESTNAKVRENKAREEKAELYAAAREQAEDLTKQIEELRQKRIDRLASAEWPVEGLGFGENGVTFNGLPFDQCSSAEQLRISTAVALSQNPKLPIGIIRDGSLLDSDGMQAVAEVAKQYGAQLWIERVGDGEECTLVIEDGEVAARSVEECAAAG